MSCCFLVHCLEETSAEPNVLAVLGLLEHVFPNSLISHIYIYLGNRHFTTGFSECMHGVLTTLGWCINNTRSVLGLLEHIFPSSLISYIFGEQTVKTGFSECMDSVLTMLDVVYQLA